jgi:hypothetical protein
LGWLSAPAAFAVWTVFGWGCAAAAAWLIAEACPPSSPLTIVSVALVSVAGATATASGQVTWPLLLIVTLGWLADRRGRGRATGMWIGIMIAVKMFFCLWLADLVIRGARRTLVFGVAFSLVLLWLGMAVYGMSGYRSWIQALQRVH